MSHQISKKEAAQQQVQQQGQYARDTETQEHHSSANAQAGLNLNLFGALSGALSSKSKKTTHTNPDGSSMQTEDRHDQALANGAAQGNGSAYGAANVEDHGRKQKSREIGQGQAQSKQVAGKEVNHLGIEG